MVRDSAGCAAIPGRDATQRAYYAVVLPLKVVVDDRCYRVTQLTTPIANPLY